MFDDPSKGIDTLGTSKHATDSDMMKKLRAIDPSSRIPMASSGSYSEDDSDSYSSS